MIRFADRRDAPRLQRYLLRFLAVALAALLGACATVTADSTGMVPDFRPAGLEAGEVRAFFSELQRAVREDDRPAVAALVSYPLRVPTGDGARVLADPGAFLGSYPEIITERVRRAVEGQRFEDLAASYRGVRIGRGEVWIGGVYPDGALRYEVKLIAVNP